MQCDSVCCGDWHCVAVCGSVLFSDPSGHCSGDEHSHGIPTLLVRICKVRTTGSKGENNVDENICICMHVCVKMSIKIYVHVYKYMCVFICVCMQIRKVTPGMVDAKGIFAIYIYT